ncbi:hypothetical protein [Actimicrobium antarcticum]|uniref:Uncharacterized protein n=1 Tax=Actimicrobium antarcticum TaxID=1051899 RepID=A0ABP7TSN6_9BURK
MASDPAMSANNDGPLQGGASELLPADLLSENSVSLPVFDTDNLLVPVAAGISAGSALHLADLLDAGGGLSGEGGFLVFDHQSLPGTTIVRVMLEDAAHHQLFEIGTLAGCGPDLNGLLGLISPDAGLA